MRSLSAALVLGLAAGLCLGSPVRAWAFPGQTPAAGPVRLRLEARAVDQSETLRRSHGSQGAGGQEMGGHGTSAQDVALAGAELELVVYDGAGRELVRGQAVADDDGTFQVDLGEVPAGSRVEARAVAQVAAESGADGQQAGPVTWYAPPWQVGRGTAPGVLRFYALASQSLGIGQSITQVATVMELPNEPKSVQVRQFVTAINVGFHAWKGFHVPVPAGMELLVYQAPDGSTKAQVQTLPHGGKGIIYDKPIFPTEWNSQGAGRDSMFMCIFQAPWEDGAEYDVGMHAEYPVFEYSLNLQEPGLLYSVPQAEGALVLADAGMNDAMGASRKPTHAWQASEVSAHTNVGARFRAGRPAIAARTWWTVGVIFAVIACAVIAGRLLAGVRPGAGGAPVPAGKRSHADTRGDLDRLERQFAQGRITRVEYAARRGALGAAAGEGAGAGPRRPEGPQGAGAAAAQDPVVLGPGRRKELRLAMEGIEARAERGDADPRKLAEDLGVVARALREILG